MIFYKIVPLKTEYVEVYKYDIRIIISEIYLHEDLFSIVEHDELIFLSLRVEGHDG